MPCPCCKPPQTLIGALAALFLVGGVIYIVWRIVAAIWLPVLIMGFLGFTLWGFYKLGVEK